MGNKNTVFDGEFNIVNNSPTELSTHWGNTTNQVPFFLYSPMTLRRTTPYGVSSGLMETFDKRSLFPVAVDDSVCYDSTAASFWEMNGSGLDTGTGSLNDTITLGEGASFSSDGILLPNFAQAVFAAGPDLSYPSRSLKIKFKAASGAKFVSLWSRRDGAVNIAGDKLMSLNPAGQIEFYQAGTKVFTSHISKDLRDGEWHTIDFLYFTEWESGNEFWLWMVDDLQDGLLSKNNVEADSATEFRIGNEDADYDPFEVAYMIYRQLPIV